MQEQNSNPVCVSGGAKGADLLWGEMAAKAGHDVIHLTFRNSRHTIPEGQEYILDDEQLKKADKLLDFANKSLKRKWPVTNPYTASLLRRNYYQVRDSDSLYAVSHLDSYGQVSGGTAWAVQMMIDIHQGSPVWLFDQKVAQWYSWKGSWMPCMKPPCPSGIYAAVGSRDLNQCGEMAIRSLY
jgi:hypothetical protein